MDIIAKGFWELTHRVWCFTLGADILVTLMLVHVSSENVPIKTFNISFESTRNKQQYGTKTTGI